MPVHLYGQICDPTLFERFGVPIVEDAAQAIGAPIKYGAISLYGSKTVGCGEGGIVVCDSVETGRFLRVVRNQGMGEAYEYVVPGFNYRMSDLSAAVALGQITGLQMALRARRANAERLWELLHDLPIDLPNPFAASTWHLFTIRTPNRGEIARALAEAGVESRVYYPKVLPDVEWLPDADVPNARRLADQVLSIPVHEHLTSEQVEMVAEGLREAVDRCVV
jgi:dTDP-4-amino-4,6-dideoxygalactose transaminase